MDKILRARFLIIGAAFVSLIGYMIILYASPTIKPVQHVRHRERHGPLIQRYYVAAVRLSDARTNVTSRELRHMAKAGKITVARRDIAAVSRFVRANVRTSAPTGRRIIPDSGGIAIIRVDDLTPGVRACTVDGASIWHDARYPLHATVQKSQAEREFDRSKVIRITAVGDIILGRTVYRKMAEYGYGSPFRNVAAKLSKADITVGDLETPLSNAFTPPIHGMQFLAPKMAVRGLTRAGFDVVSLANNHSTNFGSTAFLDTLEILSQNKIAYTGAGKNEAEATSYTVLAVKGKRFAFIGVNSIIGDQTATTSSPGDWHISLAPWGSVNQREVNKLAAKVTEARRNSDYVVVIPHWAQEYTRDPNPQMRSLAYRLIDAGADLVIGTHPHWVQGIEIYKNRFVAYSLGNFVFDQEWSQETKQGLLLDATFYQDRLINVELLPTLIEDYHRPRILYGKEAAPIMNAVKASSARINKNFR